MRFIKAKQMRTPNAYFICDRTKNYLCSRVRNNMPCGECKGTKFIKFAKEFSIDNLKSSKQYHYECSISNEFRKYVCCDAWGCVSLTLGNIGVEYNFCVDDGENYSGIYKMEYNSDIGVFETDPTVFVPYAIDFDNPEWEKDLENALCEALTDFHSEEIK